MWQGLWKQEGESQPENPSSHGLPVSPPVACERLYSSLCFQSLWSDNKGAAGKHFPEGCGKISLAQHTWKMTRVIPMSCWKHGKGISQMNCKISRVLSVPLVGLEIKTIKMPHLKTLCVVQNPVISVQSNVRHCTYCMVWICINALYSSLIRSGCDCC